MPQSPSGDLEDECDEVQIGDKDTVAGRSTNIYFQSSFLNNH